MISWNVFSVNSVSANEAMGNLFQQSLQDGSQVLGISLNPELLDRYDRYFRLLLEWNRRFNLTSITDETEAAFKLFLDSLVPLPFLPNKGLLLDVGSGGGFPGIPLKMARPELIVHLADSSRKKVSFQKQVILELQLKEIYAHQVRLDEHAQGELHAGTFDVVISRALGPINELVAIGGRYLSKEGLIISMKGPKVEEELSLLQPGSFLVREVIRYTLPPFQLGRSLIIISRPPTLP
jgi:16S rRNA (guanine527-N7)-methyltransferase